jgi:translation initiation factor 2B subunit (eIF-2B alpha/beta/delta family)
MSEENQNQNQLNIELSEEIAEGIYSNLAIITHSNSEFVLDFIKVMPGVPKAKVKSRILLTPQHAKRLLAALKDNISKFETVNGVIKADTSPAIPMNFGGPTAQA